MTHYGRILIAGAGSALLLLGALGFQYLGGLAPCPMCIWQRWPHLAAAVLSVIAVSVLWHWSRPLAGVGAVLMAVSAGLGLFHAGVEQGWWRGLESCSAASPTGQSAEALLAQITAAPIVRCDEIAWDFMGLSMAGWNAIVSLALAMIWAGSVIWHPNRGSKGSATAAEKAAR